MSARHDTNTINDRTEAGLKKNPKSEVILNSRCWLLGHEVNGMGKVSTENHIWFLPAKHRINIPLFLQWMILK